MIFGDTPLHCDPHGGNIAIRPNDKRTGHNFDVILYDHGLYRDIPLRMRRNYAKLWLAVMEADEKGMRRYAREVAGITDKQFPLFASAITGRDYQAVTTSVVSTRSEQEKEVVSGAMGDGMLQELVQLLGQVPRIVLLILKTNDLSKFFFPSPLPLPPQFLSCSLNYHSPKFRRKTANSRRSRPQFLDPCPLLQSGRLSRANGHHP